MGGYYINIFMVEDSCEFVCEKCIRKETTQVELEYVKSGNKWDIEYWPVRNPDGSTKISPRGAVVMKKFDSTKAKNLKPRTFQGDEIHGYSEDSYGNESGEGLYCECGEELIEPYSIVCEACGEKVIGGEAMIIDCTTRNRFCSECMEKLSRIKQVEDKLQEIYKKLLPVALGKKARIDLGRGAFYKDAYLWICEIIKAFEGTDGLVEWYEYVQTQMEEFEYHASRNNGPAKTIFHLFEVINEFTFEIEGIKDTVFWSELDEIEEVQEKIQHYHDYGY